MDDYDGLGDNVNESGCDAPAYLGEKSGSDAHYETGVYYAAEGGPVKIIEGAGYLSLKHASLSRACRERRTRYRHFPAGRDAPNLRVRGVMSWTVGVENWAGRG